MSFETDIAPSHDDPIWQLVQHLYERGRPSLAWVVEVGHVHDPANHAWRSGRHSGSMVDLLSICVEAGLVPEAHLRAAIVAQNTVARMFNLGFRRAGADYEPTAAAMVRAVVPAIPPLTALIAGADRLRAGGATAT